MSPLPPPATTPVFPDDAAIPVLTERLALPAVELDVTPPQPPAAPVDAAVHLETAQLEAAVRSAALAELHAELRAELPRLVEAALRDELAGTVDDAVRDMLALLQVTLEGRVRQIVKRSVEDALARLPGAGPAAR